MTDIAKLGFQVDTKDLDVSVRKLNSMKLAGAGAQNAARKLAKAATGASMEINRLADRAAKGERIKANEIEKAQMRIKRTIEATNLALKKQDAQLNAVAMGVRRSLGAAGAASGVTPANDLMPNRFNTANIAAQFQDIGVTAAMGMNPLTIALQQGTQLSAILNTMESPLRGIAQAFRSIINPVSLLSIGIVALIAAGVQFVDWTMVAKNGLNALANGVEVAADAIVAFLPLIAATGVAFIGWNLPAIAAGVVTLSKALLGLLTSLWALAAANPFGAMIVGITAVLTAVYMFRDEITKILGFDIFMAAKNAGNGIINAFVGAFDFIVTLFSNLPKAFADVFIRTVNGALVQLERLVNDYAWLIDQVLGTSLEGIKFDQFENNFEGAAARGGMMLKEKMDQGLRDVDYLGTVGAGITGIADKAAGQLRNLANKVTLGDSKEKKDPYGEIIKGAERRIASLKAEREAVGLTAREADFLKQKQDLLNQAQQKNINLTPQQTARLTELAGSMADIREETRRTEEAFNFLKDTGKSFFTDLTGGLREGQSAWESFGNAVTNVLNRMLDKFLEVSLNMVFDNVTGAFGSSGGGGGFLGEIGSLLFSAQGNMFNRSGVTPFAKGGTFTNSVVGSPTLFQFGSGGQFGVMGEAGPEAVMPLQRGPDGSLGVKMHEGGDMGGSVTVNVINNSGAEARTERRQGQNGTEIDVYIDDIVAKKIGSSGTASDNALRDRDNRQLIRRR